MHIAASAVFDFAVQKILSAVQVLKAAVIKKGAVRIACPAEEATIRNTLMYEFPEDGRQDYLR